MPLFSSIFLDFWKFFDDGDAKWVAHHANFDINFINAELERLGKPPVVVDRIIDTLFLAKRKHPMAQNSLDALCHRYGINSSHRSKHGALLDSELLTDVYIQMIGGHQTTFGFNQAVDVFCEEKNYKINDISQIKRLRSLSPRISEKELKEHSKITKITGDISIWKKYPMNF